MAVAQHEIVYLVANWARTCAQPQSSRERVAAGRHAPGSASDHGWIDASCGKNRANFCPTILVVLMVG